MNKSFPKFAITFLMLLASCASSSNGGGDNPDSKKEEHEYRCTITWDGFNPNATFSDAKDTSKTSAEIEQLFAKKHSRKVLSYPDGEQKGIREHKVEYVLKSDENVVFTSSTSNEEFGLNKVDMNAPEVLNYLRAETMEEQFQALMAINGKCYDYSHFTLEVPVYGEEQTSILLAADKDFTVNVESYSTATDSYVFDYLLPGNYYYWKAIGKNSGTEFDGGLFKINEDNIRFGNLDKLGNMRDLGGWKVGENARVKYGMVFRGRNPDSLNYKEVQSLIEAYDFKTQIDLRIDSDGVIPVKLCQNYYYTNTNKIYNQALDPDMFLNVLAGKMITPDEDNGFRLTYKEIFCKIFDLLSKEDTYPLYFHCIHGADRTGTLAFLIEAILGVSFDDIVKDYELTSFCSKSGQRLRGKLNEEETFFEIPLVDSASDYGFQHLKELMETQSGDTFQEQVQNYLISVVGVPSTTIEAIKGLLVEQL